MCTYFNLAIVYLQFCVTKLKAISWYGNNLIVQVLQCLPVDIAATVATDLKNSANLHTFLSGVPTWPVSLIRGWISSLTSFSVPDIAAEDSCDLLSHLPFATNLQVLHIDFSVYSSRDISRVLMALEAASNTLSSKLRVLSLNRIPHLSCQHCVQLSRVCAGLAGSLTGLALSFTDDCNVLESGASLEKKLMFQARALTSLAKQNCQHSTCTCTV